MALDMGHFRESRIGGSGRGRSLLKRPVAMARARHEAGLSLVEILIAVAVMGLVTGIGGLTVRTLLPTLRADAALQQTLQAAFREIAQLRRRFPGHSSGRLHGSVRLEHVVFLAGVGLLVFFLAVVFFVAGFRGVAACVFFAAVTGCGAITAGACAA